MPDQGRPESSRDRRRAAADPRAPNIPTNRCPGEHKSLASVSGSSHALDMITVMVRGCPPKAGHGGVSTSSLILGPIVW